MTHVEVVGGNQYAQRKQLLRTALRNREHQRHVLADIVAVNLRSHPCRFELLRLDRYHLDFPLQTPLLHEQRTLQFVILPHPEQVHGYLAVADRIVFDAGETVSHVHAPHLVTVQPRHRGEVGLGYPRTVFAGHGIIERIGIARLLLTEHIARLRHGQDVVLVLHLIHLVGYGDPDVVRGLQRAGEVGLSVGKRAGYVQPVMAVTAYQHLFSLVVDEHDTIIEVGILTGQMPTKDDAHGIVRSILALEDILVGSGAHVHDVAHHRPVLRKRYERLGTGPYEPLLRMPGGHGPVGIRIADHETGDFEETVARRIQHRHPRLVAYEDDGTALHLLVDFPVVSRRTCETGPIYHLARGTLQYGHDFRLGLVAETVLRKILHILVPDEMYRPRILRYTGGKRTLHIALPVQFRIGGRYEEPVRIETEQRHGLHIQSVGVHRPRHHLGHGGYLDPRTQGHITVRRRHSPVRRPLLPLAGGGQKQRTEQGRIAYSPCHISRF